MSDETRVCAFCGGTESIEHILMDCESLQNWRKAFLPKDLSARDLVSSEVVHIMRNVAIFLKKAFKARDDRLK